MNDQVYSNAELAALRERLNIEIRRRGTFTWWDPLIPPTVGTDREPRRVLPEGSEGEVVTDRTYTVNTPSTGSLEETRNIFHPSQGDNPGGQPTDDVGNPKGSATRLDQDEIRNFVLGLAKLHDIDLFYGRDEKAGTAFRDPEDIERKLDEAAGDVLHVPNDKPITVYDPNAGMTAGINPGYDYYPAGNTYTKIQQPPIIPSGQHDGEELLPGHVGPDPTNFYDDYGAKVEPTKAKDLTSADRQVIPMVHDSYQLPVEPANLTAELDLTPGGGRVVSTAHLIDYTATSGELTATPSGKASGGWISTPGGPPAITLPGHQLKRSYNGGADRMVETRIDGKTTYDDRHPTTGEKVTRKNNVPPLTYPKGAIGDQAHMAFHPQNPYVSPEITVYQVEQDDQRRETVTEVTEGHVDSLRFGLNPRNPQRGDQYGQRSSRQTFSGVKGLCHVACTGMCYLTCDSECSESCQTTCWNRCGDACVSQCSNVCTGCSTLCYSSCKTKCETASGMSCLNAGAKAVQFTSDGAKSGGNGTPWPRNHVKYSLHSCQDCSYTCQFYANYRTTCWDALCQNMCFYSCYSYCSHSCYGGCVDNQSQHDFSKDPLQAKNSKETNSARYRTGRGQACREGCVADCVGVCQGSCDGECVTGCFFDKCVNACDDTCDTICRTSCGTGCASVCKGSCSGECNSGCASACNSSCYVSCKGGCKGGCKGCGGSGGRTYNRQIFDIDGGEDHG